MNRKVGKGMCDRIQKLHLEVSNLLRSQAVAISLASAIREVVQNSVDAGATVLKVRVDPYKMSFMVRDNGWGMSREDLDRVGIQHFTSKMHNLQDLQSLNTFGFRGEALFCVANVAQVTLISKRSDNNSIWIRDIPEKCRPFEASEQEIYDRFPVYPIAQEESGTIVIVRNLLHNVPIRRKMLENEPLFKTLLSLKEEFLQIVILKPDISLTVCYFDHLGRCKELISSTNITNDLNQFTKLSHSFSNIFGQTIPTDMFTKVSARFRDCSLSGLISRYPVRSKELQYIYLNGRRYANHSFRKLINTIFQTAGFGEGRIESNSLATTIKDFNNYPLIILDVRCPQVVQDLIQDPAKIIVSSSHAQVLHPLILRVIKSFLSHQGYVTSSSTDTNDLKASNNSVRNICPRLPSRKVTSSNLNSNVRVTKLKTHKMTGRNSPVIGKSNNDRIKMIFGQLAREPSEEGIRINEMNENSNCMHISTSNWNGLSQTEKLGVMDFKLSKLQLFKAEVIGQIDKKFILFKIPSNESMVQKMLVVVDQHACDERINLEKYLSDFLYQVLEGTLANQPVSDCAIDISITESYLFLHYEREFRKWGIFYEIRVINLETCLLIISHLPDILVIKIQGDKKLLKNALLQMVYDLKNSVQVPIGNKHIPSAQGDKFQWWKYLHCLPRVFREVLNSRACRSAIMFGDFLSTSECSLLIRQLAQCRTPFQCAHGRPSAIPLLGLGSIEDNAFGPLRTHTKNLYLDYDIDS